MEAVLSVFSTLSKYSIRFVSTYPITSVLFVSDIAEMVCEDGGALFGIKVEKKPEIPGIITYGDVAMVDASAINKVVKLVPHAATDWYILICKGAKSFSASAFEDRAIIEVTSEPSPRAITRYGKVECSIEWREREVVVRSFTGDVYSAPCLHLLEDAKNLASALSEIRNKLGAREVHADGWFSDGGIEVYDIDIV